jgi:hypothetical protein
MEFGGANQVAAGVFRYASAGAVTKTALYSSGSVVNSSG